MGISTKTIKRIPISKSLIRGTDTKITHVRYGCRQAGTRDTAHAFGEPKIRLQWNRGTFEKKNHLSTARSSCNEPLAQKLLRFTVSCLCFLVCGARLLDRSSIRIPLLLRPGEATSKQSRQFSPPLLSISSNILSDPGEIVFILAQDTFDKHGSVPDRIDMLAHHGNFLGQRSRHVWRVEPPPESYTD